MAEIDLPPFKICSKCGERKATGRFHRNHGRLNSQCIECRNQARKMRIEENPEKYRLKACSYSAVYRRRHPEKIKQYREDHKEKIDARAREWGRRHPDRRRAAIAKSHRKHAEKERAYRRQNRQRIDAKIAEWRAANPEYFTVTNQRRRARIKNATGSHTRAEIKALLEKQDYLCANPFCRADLRVSKRALDHIVSLTRGGSNGIDNLQWLCRPCNQRKFNLDPVVWLDREASKQGES